MYTPMPSFELLRAHYGDNCWWCDQPIDFTLKPANPKSATREHLQPIKRHGGTNDLANLRICHKHCNQHLANHDRATKERMREALAHRRAVVARTPIGGRDVEVRG